MLLYEVLEKKKRTEIIEMLTAKGYKFLSRKKKEELIKMYILDQVIKPLQRSFRSKHRILFLYKKLKKKRRPKLINILTKKGYKSISRKKKDELAKMYILDQVIKPLQRSFRSKYFKPVDGLDDITFDKLEYPFWNKKVSNNKRYYYNLETIITHILKNRVCKKLPLDPISMTHYTIEDIRELNYLYKYFDYSKKFSHLTLYQALKDKKEIDIKSQQNYENERIEILKDYIIEAIDSAMEEFILYHNDCTDYTEEEIKNILIDVLKEIYNFFYWLRPLSEYWFNATFKMIYQKIDLYIQLGKYPPKEHILYVTIFETIEGVKELCNTKYESQNNEFD